MGIEQQMMQPQQPPNQGQPPADTPEPGDTSDQGGDGANTDELDLKIAVMLGERLLEEGGFDVIEKALGSSDPGQVIGQFLMQMGQQMMESMPDGITLSPKILLAKGGWVEQISDYIQEKGVAKKAIMDKAEIYVASTSQKMAQAKGGMAGGVQAPPSPQVGADPSAPPTMPQGAQ